MFGFYWSLRKGIQLRDVRLSKYAQMLLEFKVLEIRHQRYFLKEKFILGQIRKEKRGTFLKIPGNATKYSIFADECNDGDWVLVFKKAKGYKVLSVLKEQNVQRIAYLAFIKGVPKIFDFQTHRLLKSGVREKALKTLPDGTIFLLQKSQIVEVLGTLDNPRIDEKISLNLYHKQEEFSASVLQESESFGSEVDISLYPNRVDLRHLPFCTIDPETAKDFDDAIFYDSKNAELYVAIADVSAYVAMYSALDKEARKRGFSIYLPHKSIPMLPHQLSENLCSLKPFESRLAYVWKIRLHRGCAKILDSHLFEAFICSQRRFTYTEVDKILKSPPEQESQEEFLAPMILSLFKQMQKIRKKRLEFGYDFYSEEERISLNADFEIQDIKLEISSPSHELVEEAMLLANLLSAKRLQEFLPLGIYRSHKPPKKDRIQELFSFLRTLEYTIPKKDLHKQFLALQKAARKRQQEKEISRLMIKSQSNAEYTSENQGHFGLGFECYTHFTSPIRRYVDLCVHRLLKNVDHKSKHYLQQELNAICDEVNQLEKENAKVEIDFKDRIYARWAMKNIGRILDAIVIDEHYPILGRACSDIYGARLLIEGDNLEFYQKVKVKISQVDLCQAKIFCEVAKGNFNYVS
ncbi:hypothetical protein CCZ01_07305 [Helicobacter monodelphidis]|uniref:RNB domain-containing ribonuclease n=1 Tax=Helicobacter sp. 15-1451 TaxID=2004995 RepID=UPI000DCE3759|nr:ribonuclease R family protein [Helicobacter sp. 15-1451]RAX57143.1 hypothetical protein CCZ01_07305 [Helicobacter sp. 15-1451]